MPTFARAIDGRDAVSTVPDAAIDERSLRLLHAFALIVCAALLAMDFMEIGLGAAYAAIFSVAPYRLGGFALTALLCSVYAGAVVGAPLLGWLADRRGLRTALAAAAFWLATTSWLAGMSGSTTMLIVWRALSGIALGGLPPLIIAYMTDLAPKHFRGPVIFAMCAIAYLAPPATTFFMRATIKHAFWGLEAWRWPLLAGASVSLVAVLLLGALTEGPHWLAATGRRRALARFSGRLARSPVILRADTDDVTRPAMASAPSRRKTGGRLALLSGISATLAAATVSFPLVTGPLLLARHVDLSDTLLYIGLANFGPIGATLLTGLFVDRFRRRDAMLVCAIVMLAATASFVLSGSALIIGASLIVFMLMTTLYMPVMTTFGAELFHPSIRARATSIAWLANRSAGTIAPALLIPLSRGGHVTWVGAMLCVFLIANLLILVRFGSAERFAARPSRVRAARI